MRRDLRDQWDLRMYRKGRRNRTEGLKKELFEGFLGFPCFGVHGYRLSGRYTVELHGLGLIAGIDLEPGIEGQVLRSIRVAVASSRSVEAV